MNSGKIKKLLILLYIAVYIATGFFREFVFLNINEQRRVTYSIVYRHQPEESYVAPSMHWLSQFSYEFLTNLKWPLTLFFAIVFAFLATRVIRTAFGAVNLVRLTWMAYALVFLLGLVFYFIGWLAGQGQEDAPYAIARFLAGLTETPALLVILFAAFLAIRRSKDNSAPPSA